MTTPEQPGCFMPLAANSRRRHKISSSEITGGHYIQFCLSAINNIDLAASRIKNKKANIYVLVSNKNTSPGVRVA